MGEERFETITNSIAPGSRYRAILRQVLERLPAGWDESRPFGMLLQPAGPAYASVNGFLIDDQDDVPQWLVVLSAYGLDRLSDRAVSWVLAHALAHVTSESPCGRGGRIVRAVDSYRILSDVEIAINEGTADAIACLGLRVGG